MTGQGRRGNQRGSKFFNGLGRFRPREMQQHLLRSSQLERSTLRREFFHKVIGLGPGGVLLPLVHVTMTASTRKSGPLVRIMELFFPHHRLTRSVRDWELAAK